MEQLINKVINPQSWYIFENVTPKDFWIYCKDPGFQDMPERLKDGKKEQIKVKGPFAKKRNILDYFNLTRYLRAYGISFMHRTKEGWYHYSMYKENKNFNIIRGNVLLDLVFGPNSRFDISAWENP
jgi:hypothetical protein